MVITIHLENTDDEIYASDICKKVAEYIAEGYKCGIIDGHEWSTNC
jgi:hypothetical protein